MFTARLLVVLSTLLGALIALPAQGNEEVVQTAYNRLLVERYESCSYPPSKPGKYVPNARSWKQQGLASAVRGIDVSMWQHPQGADLDFADLAASRKVKFVIIKASDGGNRDKGKSAEWFPHDRAAAKAAGIIVGAYHYAVPGAMHIVPSADARLQARQAVRRAMGVPVGDLPLTLDFEELPCDWSVRKTVRWAQTFVLEVERISGRKPMIYANTTFIKRLAKGDVPKSFWREYRLWVAQWGPKLGPTPKSVPIWGDKWTFWQFTADGKLSQVPSTATDLDVFNGSLAQLQALANSD